MPLEPKLRSVLLVAFGFLLCSAVVSAAERNGTVAVYSSVSPAFARTTLPDGSLKPVTFAFGEGGDLGGPQADSSIDKLKFKDIAHLIAPALESQNYVLTKSKDPRQTELLIVIFWGTTIGSNDNGGLAANPVFQMAQSLMSSSSGNTFSDSTQPDLDGIAEAQSLIAMASSQRDRQNWENAAILGYLPEYRKRADLQAGQLQHIQEDILTDIEENRYFIVLIAYDFQSIIRKHEKRMLWQTRYSIREHKNAFDVELPSMSQYASKYFGKSSGGLLRKPLAETSVTVGDTKFLGFEGEEKK